MKPTRTYPSPAAFKAALEQRLRNVADPPIGIARRRQLLIFDRCLARLVRVLGDAIVLKGGFALELQLERARTTRDIDLRLVGSPDALLLRIQEAGRLDLADFMMFEIHADTQHPEITAAGVPYQGQRFVAECRVAGRRYGDPFGIDIGVGDPIFGAPEVIMGNDLLDFIGISPAKVSVYPVESHVAEKLHAYTLPRKTTNSRVKDLPDIALLAQTGPRDARRLRAALEQTFSFRKTHGLPPRLPDPPGSWVEPYAKIAEDDALEWQDLTAVTAAVRAFLDPVLASSADARWSPKTWSWTPGP